MKLNFDKIYNHFMNLNENIGMDTFWEDGDVRVTIEDILTYFDNNNIGTIQVDVSKIKPLLINQDYNNLQKDRVEKADISFPILIVKSKGKYKSILDGNHRVFKAIKNNVEKLPARVLDLDDPKTPKDFKKIFE